MTQNDDCRLAMLIGPSTTFVLPEVTSFTSNYRSDPGLQKSDHQPPW